MQNQKRKLQLLLKTKRSRNSTKIRRVVYSWPRVSIMTLTLHFLWLVQNGLLKKNRSRGSHGVYVNATRPDSLRTQKNTLKRLRATSQRLPFPF